MSRVWSVHMFDPGANPLSLGLENLFPQLSSTILNYKYISIFIYTVGGWRHGPFCHQCHLTRFDRFSADRTIQGGKTHLRCAVVACYLLVALGDP